MIRNPPPNPAQAAAIDHLKRAFEAAETEILKTVSNNRERALALTNLEQASMWATKAVLEDMRHKVVQA